MNRSHFTVGLVMLFLAGCGGGGDGGTTSMGSSSCPALLPPPSPAGSLASVVDGIAASEMQSRHLPGQAISVSKQGTILYAQGYGYANLGSCVPVQASTAFEIGSVTKQFTAVAVLQLVDKGSLNLDGAVSEVLPAYGFDSRITVRMLLNHTSGLSDYTSFPDAPGAAYSYSDSNYYVLGSIIESITGSSYADYLTVNVLHPAQLDHTTYLQPLSYASPYTLSWTQGALWDTSFTYAAGALWSSVADLAAWNRALTSNTVIPASLFELTVTPPNASSQYGMGWWRTTQLGRPFVLHDSKTASYTAFNGMFLDNGFSIAIATNVALPNGESFEGTATKLIGAIPE